jgi:hypothetical protein
LVPEPPAIVRGEVARITTENSDLSLVGADRPDEDPQEGRLAAPAGPDEAEDRACRDREIDAVHRPRPAESLLHAGGPDGGLRAGRIVPIERVH